MKKTDKSKVQAAPNGEPQAPVDVPAALALARNISVPVTLHLYVRAGGRCEFDGCSEYLMEHPTTSTIGNFGQQAHIYAFNEGGPRGASDGRPQDVNGIENLMLLCARCHHLIDKVEPQKYPVEVLRKFKQAHEERIFQLTAIPNDRDTIPLIVKAQIAGRTMEISDAELQHASAPNYIRVRDKVTVDLSEIPDSPEAGYFQTGARAIDAKIDTLERIPASKGGSRRVSVFALAPIPLLVYLGSRLSDKWIVDLHQRRRTGENNPWTWEPGEGSARFTHRKLKEGPEGVGLLINLSGRNGPDKFGTQAENWSIHEIILEDDLPNPTAIRTHSDLDRFKATYIRALAVIRDSHISAKEIHVLAAVPAPVAICLGMLRLPKVDPHLIVYDRDQRTSELLPLGTV